MRIIRAKTAGFCFGVARAVDMTYDLLNEGVRVATLGPLIHNPSVWQTWSAAAPSPRPCRAGYPRGMRW